MLGLPETRQVRGHAGGGKITAGRVFWMVIAYELGRFVWSLVEMVITGKRRT